MAIKKVGARIFTRIDYKKSGTTVGLKLSPTTIVIFGNPKIGASAFLAGQTIGLYLPLRVLAYEDKVGSVWLIYNDPAEAAKRHGIPVNHPAIQKCRRL